MYSVFNAEQIDGIPALELPERKPFEAIEAGETMLRNSGADIRHGGGKAYYSPRTDHIQMPPKECFATEPHYYQTLFHELAQWTGSKSRLNRLSEKAPFGSPAYAHEEIVADLTSLYLAAELGIPYEPGEQASYISSWIKVLKNDKNEVFKAASEASKASDYILGICKGQSIGETGPNIPASQTHVAALEKRSCETQARNR